MVDKVNIELDEQFLKKFFALTERVIPEDQEITLAMLRRQLDEIEEELLSQKAELQKSSSSSKSAKSSVLIDNFDDVTSDSDDDVDDDGFKANRKSILVVDDLGVITYQLSVLFKKMNFNVIDSNEIYDAIEKFKKFDFDLVIMDLFIPTDREGFILLEELKKTAQSKRKPTKIGVMSASARKDHKQLCKIKGAEFYIEKADDWQAELINIVKTIK